MSELVRFPGKAFAVTAILLSSAVSAAPSAAVTPAPSPAPPAASAMGTKPAAPLLFRGQALGADLKPLAGARATMVATPSEVTGGNEGIRWRPHGAEDGRPVFLGAVAGEDGRFEIALPSPGPWNLRVDAEGLAPTVVERVRASSVSSPVYLQPGLSLAGSIHDLSRRTPIEGARIVAVPVLDHGFEDPDDPDRFATISVSSREGGFALVHLPANFYSLRVTAPAHALGYVSRQAVDAASKEPVTIFLEPGLSVSGSVLDRAGKGIAGVDISVSRTLPRRLKAESFAAMNALQGRTDEAGRFEILGLPLADSMSLVARAKDGSRARKPLPSTDGRAAVTGMELVLDRPASVTAILHDTLDKPLRKASIDVGYDSEKGRSGPGDRFFRSSSVVKVDEAGRLSVGDIPSGSGSVAIQADGFKPWSIEDAQLKPGETLDLGTIVFERGHTIVGQVTDDKGAPLAGVNVRAHAFTGTGIVDEEAESGGDGRYLIGGLGDGRVTVTATREGMARSEKDDVTPDATGIDFTLARAGSLGGRVTTGDPAQPVTSFSVRATPKDEGRGGGGGGFRVAMGGTGDTRDFSDSRGRFNIGGLSPGTWTVEAFSRGLVPVLREDVIIASGETAELGDFLLPAGGRIAGRTVDREGAPVPGASISLRASGLFSFGGDDRSPTSLSGLDGRFVLTGLASGSQTVVAEHPEFAKTETTVRVDPAVPGEEITLALSRGGRIAGAIRDDSGALLPGATVIAFMMSDPMGASPVQSDEQGRFSFENLRAGTYNVSKVGGGPASGGRRTMVIGMGMDSKQAEVKDGETTTVMLGGEEKTIKVHGTVRKAGGLVAGARMFWIATKDSGPMPDVMRSATTGPGGSYEVSLPQGGAYSVRVSEDGASMTSGTAFSVSVPEGTTDFAKDLVFPSGVLSGLVLRASDNSPVDNATLSAQPDGDGTSSGSSSPLRRGEVTARTDSSGRYRLEGLAEGTWKVTASGGGLAAAVVEGVRIKGEGEGQADFALRSGSVLRVKVLDPDGRPVRGALLIPIDASGEAREGFRGASTTGADGTGLVEGLEPGPCSLLALSRDLAPAIQSGIDVPESGEGAVEIRIPAGGSLEVKVLDADGAPVSGATPSLVDATGVKLDSLMPSLRMISGLPATTGKDGAISYPLLAPGKQTVTVTQGSLSASGTVTIVEGKSASLLLKLK